MSVDPNANVMPLWGFVRRKPRRPRTEEEPVRESRTRALIDETFEPVGEAASQRYSHLKKQVNLPKKGKYNVATDPYNKWIEQRNTPTASSTTGAPYHELTRLTVNDFSVKGQTVLLLLDPQGRSYVGTGPNLSAAMDAMANRKHGLEVLEQLLDLDCVLFIGDGKYDLKQVLSRSKDAVKNLENNAVSEIKQSFNVPANLDMYVGFKTTQNGELEWEMLDALLGRSEAPERFKA